MIPVGQPYRPAGPVDLRAVLTTLILGLFTAAFAALPIWLWEVSGVPTLFILTTCLQALIIGAALNYMIGRLRLRNPRLVGAIAVACGLASVFLIHYGHYLRFINQAAAEIRSSVKNDSDLTPDQKKAFLARIDDDPSPVVNGFLTLETGHGGFFGFLQMRSKEGIRLKNIPVSGVALWLLWGAEACLAGFIAKSMAKDRASKPFCEDCGHWCQSEPDLFTLPASAGDPLVDAIADDAPARVDALRLSPPADTNQGLVGVSLFACPGCDQAFADASLRVSDGKNTKVTPLVHHLRVSPEMAHALRYPPPAPAQPEATADAAGAEELDPVS